MIQFNKEYSINKDKGTIYFEKINKEIIAAVYFRGTITAKWVDDTLKGTFYDAVGNGFGLIEFTFTPDGFDAKWKGGLKEGPMKGQWTGKIL